MYDHRTRLAALASIADGRSLRSVSITTGISRAALREWRDRGPQPLRRVSDCPRCVGLAPSPPRAYLYLLGLYLGDGCVSEAARTTALRIACADAWPGLLDECVRTVELVSRRTAFRVSSQGCTYITVLWKHWPCLFPQHGPGRKHARPITLEHWQQDMVSRDPRPLIRGLLHSDGWRGINSVRRDVAGKPLTYRYPRYLFTNESADIRRILTDALDHMGIAWRQNRRNSISIARRDAVAALDEFVGPKS